MKAEKTNRILDVFKMDGEHDVWEFEYDIVLKDYILERDYIREYEEDGYTKCVYLIAEASEENEAKGLEPIDSNVFISHRAEDVADFFELLIHTNKVVLMEFETYAEAFMVWQYFDEGHPLQGPTLIEEFMIQKHQPSLAN